MPRQSVLSITLAKRVFYSSFKENLSLRATRPSGKPKCGLVIPTAP
jgi:hypothetical protein